MLEIYSCRLSQNEINVQKSRNERTFAERVVDHTELVLEVGVPEQINLFIGRHVGHNELQVIHTQPTNAHKHREGIEQKENEQPGERSAEPVAHGGVKEEQIGNRVPHEDGHEVFVVVTAHGVVDKRTAEE